VNRHSEEKAELGGIRGERRGRGEAGKGERRGDVWRTDAKPPHSGTEAQSAHREERRGIEMRLNAAVA